MSARARCEVAVSREPARRWLAMLLLSATALTLALLAGCASQSKQEAPKAQVVTPASLETNLGLITALEPHLNELDTEFAVFPHPAKEGRDYFTAEEVDAMEGLLFRFQASQTTLWDIVNGYGGLDASFADDTEHTKAEVLALTATLLIASHSAFVVQEFADEPVAIKQMNQSYYRSEIPFGTYDRLREDVTAPGLLQAVADASEAYGGALNHPESPLKQLADSDPDYAALIAALPALHDEAAARLQQVADEGISYEEAKKLARKDARGQHKTLYAMRKFVFKSVSRLKSPTAHVVVFTQEQKDEIFGLLEPGDLVLTYTAGYMSDVFIPGAFKHGITYVGEPDARAALNLSVDNLPQQDRYEPAVVKANLETTTLPDGMQIDMIEAVAEGVIFNNLEHIMDTHINRMLVLRPRLSPAEREAFLLEVYSYLGDGYDFRFDFADATQQVCTEVIYRAINGKGDIDFSLTVRAGHETLSADDIANYHLQSAAEAFDFVLFVETDPDGKDTDALVYTGAAGEERLRELMAEVNPQ